VVVSSSIWVWVEVRDHAGHFTAVLPDGSRPNSAAHPLDTSWPTKLSYVEFSLLGQTSRRPSIQPVVSSRGTPADADPQVRQWIIEYPGVAASWLTARELLDLDWNARLRFRADLARGDFSTIPVDRSDDPIVDFDGRIYAGFDLFVPDQGPNHPESEYYPDVVEVPLVHAAPGLHSLMLSSVVLRPEDPDSVRMVYAFDQL
jgi:hypothetical protein